MGWDVSDGEEVNPTDLALGSSILYSCGNDFKQYLRFARSGS
jgi:hypothetical protein